jgi:proline iminopeptidase
MCLSGGGVSPRSCRFFDPSFDKIINFDQRGSGKSVPNAADDLKGSLVENTTPKLVQDIDALRRHLKIDKWGLVLGGFWGTTLALAYAQEYPDDVDALLLRGVFLFTPDEVDYLFCNGGTYRQNPQAWEAYCQYIQDTSSDWDREQRNLLGAYWDRLTSDDEAVRKASATAFVGYELSLFLPFSLLFFPFLCGHEHEMLARFLSSDIQDSTRYGTVL